MTLPSCDPGSLWVMWALGAIVGLGVAIGFATSLRAWWRERPRGLRWW